MKRHMKKIHGLVPFLCTLLLLAVGFSMPSLASSLLDYRLTQAAAQREDIKVSLELTQSTDFFNTLAAFDVQQSRLEMTEGYRMTLAEAKAEANKVVRQINKALTQRGVEGWDGYEIKQYGSSPVVSDPEVIPLLIANIHDPSQSGIFWECVWSWPGSDERTILWLDDQSGRLVAFYGNSNTSSKSSSYVYVVEDPYENIAAAVAEFCKSYYRVNDVVISDTTVTEASSRYYALNFVREMGADTLSISIPLSIRHNRLYFNL